MLIAIRTDSSSVIGIGHVSRTLTLAQRLRTRGCDVVFCVQNLSGSIHAQIEQAGFRLMFLASLEKELCLSCLQELSPDLVLLDHYGIDSADEQFLKEHLDVPLVAYDDTYQQHAVDCVINHNMYAEPSAYSGKIPEDALCLCGMPYAALRDEFIPYVKAEELSLHQGRVLVTMGGADPQHVTPIIMQALLKEDTRPVDVVIGSAYQCGQDIKDIASEHPARFTVHEHVQRLAPLMETAEIVIAGAGVTSLEIACVGRAMILGQLAENQCYVADYMRHHSLAVVVEDVLSQASWQQAFENIQQDIHAFSKRCAVFAKQWSPSVLPKALIRLACRTVALRPARTEDCRLWFDLANDPLVRQGSFCSDEITWDEHQQWFAGSLANPKRCLLALISNKVFLGQVRFDEQGNDDAVIGISLSPLLRGCGMAAQVLRMAVAQGPQRRILAEIKENNTASIRAFLAAGFSEYSSDATKKVYQYDNRR